MFWESSCIWFDISWHGCLGFPILCLNSFLPPPLRPKPILSCVDVPFSVSRGTRSKIRSLTVNCRFLFFFFLFSREARCKTTRSLPLSSFFFFLQMNLNFFPHSLSSLLITEFGKIILCKLFSGFIAIWGATTDLCKSTGDVNSVCQIAQIISGYSMLANSLQSCSNLSCTCWPLVND